MESEKKNSSSELSTNILETEIKLTISDLKLLTENEIINTGYVQRIKDNLLPKIVSNIPKEHFGKSIQELQEEAFIRVSNKFYVIGINNLSEDRPEPNFKSYEVRLLEGIEFQELGQDDKANHTFLKVIN